MIKGHVKMVGPMIRDPEIAEALFVAIETDNPGIEVTFEDRSAYVKIQTPGRCRITYDSLKEALGRSFSWSEITQSFVSFAGRINFVEDRELIFYLEREDN